MAPSVLFLRFKPQEFKAFFQTAGEVNSSICKTSDQLDHNGGQAEAGQVAPHQKKKLLSSFKNLSALCRVSPLADEEPTRVSIFNLNWRTSWQSRMPFKDWADLVFASFLEAASARHRHYKRKKTLCCCVVRTAEHGWGTSSWQKCHVRNFSSV